MIREDFVRIVEQRRGQTLLDFGEPAAAEGLVLETFPAERGVL